MRLTNTKHNNMISNNSGSDFDSLYDDDDGCLGSFYDDQDYSVACREFDCRESIICFASYDYTAVYDTVSNNVYDTTYNTVYDILVACQEFDCRESIICFASYDYSAVYNTVSNNVYDTTYDTVYDILVSNNLLYYTGYDTAFYAVNKTGTMYNTVFYLITSTWNDTLFYAVNDTMTVYYNNIVFDATTTTAGMMSMYKDNNSNFDNQDDSIDIIMRTFSHAVTIVHSNINYSARHFHIHSCFRMS